MTIRDIAVAFGFEVDHGSLSAAEGAVNKLKGFAAKALGALGIGFSVAQLGKFAKECTDIASNVSEMQSKFDVVFGNMKDEVNDWADNFADSIGRSRSTIKTYLADQQNLLVGFTDGSEEARANAAKLSEQMTSLALDIASFANTDEDVAVERMTRAVMGETEAAKGLGAVLTDVTRKEAMQRMELNGSYDSLDQYTKMMVNLNAIEYQSKDAIGDCVNSMDRYESKTRQLAARQKDLKEFIGTQLMPVMSEFTGFQIKMAEGAMKVAKAILGESAEDNKLLKVMDRIHALAKRLQPTFDRMGQALSNGMSKARNFIGNVVEKLGGVENVLKIAGIAATAFFAVMSAAKIMAVIQAAGGLIGIFRKVAAVFSLAHLKIFAIVAVITAVVLAVEDFVHFMKGDASVIGTLFDKWGIGSENARKAIIGAWEKVKTFLSDTWDMIKDAASRFVDFFKKLFSGDWEGVWNIMKEGMELGRDALKKGWDKIKEVSVKAVDALPGLLSSGWEWLKQTVSDVGAALGPLLDKGWEWLKSAAKTAVEALPGLLSSGWELLKTGISTVGDAIGPLLDKGWELLKNAAKTAVEALPGLLSSGWELLKTGISAVGDTLGPLLDAGWELLKSAAKTAVEALPGALSAGWDLLKSGISTVGSGLGNLLDEGWNALKTAAGTAVEALPGFVSEKFETLKTTISGVGDGLGTLLDEGWTALKTAAGDAADWIQEKWDGIKDFFSGIWDSITGGSDDSASSMESAGEAVSGAGDSFSEAGTAMSEAGETAVSAGDSFSQAGEAITLTMTGTVEDIASGTQTIQELVISAWERILSVTVTAWTKMREAVVTSMNNMKSTVSSGVSQMKASFDSMSTVASSAYQWGYDICAQMANGINAAAGSVQAAASNVASGVRSVLHFSLPDTGPLADADTYMPDFMKLLAQGISSNEDEVFDKVRSVAGGIAMLTKAAVASPATAMAGAVTNRTSSVTQNVDIYNSYTGGTMETQRNVSRAMKKSATDATTEMARALAYARG